jgi:cytochrome c
MIMPVQHRKRLTLLAVIFVGAVAAAGIANGAKWYAQAQSDAVARAMTAGEPLRAPALMRRYGCSGCHTIPGIPGADGQVGASLSDMRRRVYVGGVAFNSPQNLVQWIVSPQTFSEHSAMPSTGISEAEAKDVAAYLYAR